MHKPTRKTPAKPKSVIRRRVQAAPEPAVEHEPTTLEERIIALQKASDIPLRTDDAMRIISRG